MHVSKNGGDSWDPVQVPTVTPERVLSLIIETFVLFYRAIACRAGVILVRECSVFSQRKLWPPSLILMATGG